MHVDPLVNSPSPKNGEEYGNNPYPESSPSTISHKPAAVGTNPFPGNNTNTPKENNLHIKEELSENSKLEHETKPPPVNAAPKTIKPLDYQPELSKISVCILIIMSFFYIYLKPIHINCGLDTLFSSGGCKVNH